MRKTKEQSQLVVKGNDLVQHSRYALDLQQLKILSYMISKIKPTDEPNTVYEITVKDYCKISNTDANETKGYY
jgi:hypothetical protein